MKNGKHISEWVRKKGNENEESALAYFIRFAYSVFSNRYVQAAVSLVGTIVIAVMIGFGYYDCGFWVVIAAYVVATFLIAWANGHVRQKNRDTKTFQHTLFGLGASLRAEAITFQKCAKKLKNVKNAEKAKQLVADGATDFQAAAFIVCEKLCDTLSRKGEKDVVYVTVFQKEQKDDELFCRMIAYSADHEVSSYEKKYPIPRKEEAKLGKIEYHTYVFAHSIKEVSSFHTQELVQKAFCFHEECEQREKAIHQYVCIPISPAGQGVTFLLQVDCSEPGRFGTNKTALDDFAKNTIYPYAQLLHMIYEQYRVIEQLAGIEGGTHEKS